MLVNKTFMVSNDSGIELHCKLETLPTEKLLYSIKFFNVLLYNSNEIRDLCEIVLTPEEITNLRQALLLEYSSN